MPATANEEVALRLGNELRLLKAVYPESIAFDAESRELKYSPAPGDDGLATRGVLVLRLPDYYPTKGLPDLITAKDANGQDVRTQVSAAFAQLGVVEGDSAVDAYIFAFKNFVTERRQEAAAAAATPHIWLHHLLNTNKRKLALGPSLEAASVSGLTRPGYPGVMVFSGPRDAVDSHVAEPRAQRWQAFQVRYDSSEEDDRGGDASRGF
ncbi:hypothetical protein F5883DRAFT_675832 [Diaporthe sp. PMI_573]|nr:hypothetical protein F5883DRAFT_675832 [Diaporthaceae sp. PMI_573]